MQRQRNRWHGVALVLCIMGLFIGCSHGSKPPGTPTTKEDMVAAAKALHAADVARQKIFDFLYGEFEAKRIEESVINAYHGTIEPPLRDARAELNGVVVAMGRTPEKVTREQVQAAIQDLAVTVNAAKQFASKYGWKES